MNTDKLEKDFALIAPSLLGYRDELPYVPPEKVAKEAIEHVRLAGPYFVLLLKVSVMLLNLRSLFFYRASFRNLSRKQQNEFMEKCMNSRIFLWVGLPFLMKVPLCIYYWSQNEVLLTLGFNREELCSEADKHQVTR